MTKKHQSKRQTITKKTTTSKAATSTVAAPREYSFCDGCHHDNHDVSSSSLQKKNQIRRRITYRVQRNVLSNAILAMSLALCCCCCCCWSSGSGLGVAAIATTATTSSTSSTTATTRLDDSFIENYLFSKQQQQQQQQEEEQQHKTNKFDEETKRMLGLVNPRYLNTNDDSDFAALNELFKGATLKLPNASVNTGGRIPLKLDLSNMRCNNLSVHDIQVSHVVTSKTDTTSKKVTVVTLDILGLHLDCWVDYRYKYLLFKGNGNAFMETKNNRLTTVVELNTASVTSPTTATTASSTANLQSCETKLNLEDLDFDGDWLSEIANLLDDAIKGLVRRQLEDAACEQLGPLATNTLQDMMNDVVGPFLYKYLPENVAQDELDPLAAEANLVVSPEDDFFDWQQPKDIIRSGGSSNSDGEDNNGIGSWFHSALEQIDSMLSKTVTVTDDASGLEKSELAVNGFLRNLLLDDDGAYTFQVNQLVSNGGKILDSHDKLTETKITLQQVKVYGIDTLTTLEPLRPIAKYTLQNKLVWETLRFEVFVQLDIQGSTRPDSILVDVSPSRVLENIQVDLAVHNIDVTLSALLVLDRTILGNLQVGSMLRSRELLPCLLEAIYKAAVSGLAVSVERIDDPTLDGFIDEGLDRVVTDAVEAAMAMYKDILLQAMPGLFETKVERMLNTVLDEFRFDSQKHGKCDRMNVENATKIVDFRDLLDPPEQARNAGALGTEPYGDMAAKLMNRVVDDLLLKGDGEDGGGKLKINSWLIDGATKAQSNVSGSLHFGGDVVNITKTNIRSDVWSSLVESFQLVVSDVWLNNLNTLTSPIALFATSEGEPHALNNYGTFEGPLSASTKFLLQVDGSDDEDDGKTTDSSPFEMRNEFQVAVSVPSTRFFLRLLAMVREKNLLEFPLKHALQKHCWLATIPSPELDENGFRTSPPNNDQELYAALLYLTLTMQSLSLDIECTSCTTTGFYLLPAVIAILDETGVINQLRKQLFGFLAETLQSDWAQTFVDRVLYEAPMRCPHDALYDANFTSPETFASIGIPTISRSTAEMMVLSASIFVQAGAVVMAESHVYNKTTIAATSATANDNDNYLLAGELELEDVPEGVELLDLLELNTTVASWADLALEKLRKYLKSTEDGELVVNALLQRFLVDDSTGQYSQPISGVTLELGGTNFSLTQVRLSGIDSIYYFDGLDIIGSYTVSNKIAWNELRAEIDVEISLPPDEDGKEANNRQLNDAGVTVPLVDGPSKETVTMIFGLEDIAVDLTLLMAFDREKLGNVVLGSILQSSEIVPCMASALYALSSPQFKVQVGQISTPEISGFVSPQVEKVMSESMQKTFEQYEPLMIEAMPFIFNETVRVVANNLIKTYLDSRKDSECPPPDMPEAGLVDFRDLFLPANEAAAAGGRGTKPYGAIVPMLKNLVDEKLRAINPRTELPRLNDALVKALTRMQSDVEGTLSFPGELASASASNVDFPGLNVIEFGVADATIDHIDTIGMPLMILEPSSESGQLLNNSLSIGTAQVPLEGKVRIIFAIEGDPVFAMRNELNVSIAMHSVTTEVLAMAKMLEQDLFGFPFKDMLNARCWLASMAMPKLDENGVRESGTVETLGFQKLAMAMENWTFNVMCTSCSSPGLLILPEVIDTLESTDSIGLLRASMVDLSVELLKSDAVQTFIDRQLVESSKLCEHSPEYTGESGLTSYGALPFPSFTRDGMENLVFLSSVLTEVLIVAAVENHAQYATVNRDPLSAQKEFEAPPDVRLVNYANLGETVGSWMDAAFAEFNSYLKRQVDDPYGPFARSTGTDLGINVLMRSTIVDEDGLLSIEFDDLSFKRGETEITLTAIRVGGLDAFTSFNALEVIGNQTFSNTFVLPKLTLEVDLGFRVGDTPTTPTIYSAIKESEKMTVSVGFRDIEASLALLLALDSDLLGDLKVGSLLHTDQILPCLLSAAVAVDITQLDVSIGDIEVPTFSGFLNSELQASLTEITRALFEVYEPGMVVSLPKVFDTTIRVVLNNWLREYLTKEDSVACPTPETTEVEVVDFRDLLFSGSDATTLGGQGTSPYGNLGQLLKEFLDKKVATIDPIDGRSEANEVLVEPLTRRQSDIPGTIFFPGSLFSTEANVDVGGLQADVVVNIFDARVENMDSMGMPLSLFDPMTGEPHTLSNVAMFGTGMPLRGSIKVLISIKNDNALNLKNEVELSLDLDAVNTFVNALVKISQDKFFSFPVRDLLNFDCWLATLPTPSLDERGVRVEEMDPSAEIVDLAVSVAQLRLNVTCIECSSPGMFELSELFSSPAAIVESTRVANDVVDYVGKLMGGEYMQVKIDRALEKAPRKCPHRPEYNPNTPSKIFAPFDSPVLQDDSIDFLIAIAITTACLIVAAVIAAFVLKAIVRNAHRRWLKALSQEEIHVVRSEQTALDEVEIDLNRYSTSMVRSPSIPRLARILIPIIILVNIGFFLSGHLNLGGTVTIEAELAREKLQVSNFFEFSMAKSTIEIWKAGGKELAMLIFFFSGVWPYTKQLITLALWFLPPRLVPVSRRGNILLWLDALSKWSMMDIFVLLITLAAFNIAVVSPDIAFLPKNFYSVRLLVVPKWGLYANMIAQLISQLSSHFIIHYHRRTVELAKQDYEDRQPPTRTVTEDESYSLDEFGDQKPLMGREENVLHQHWFLIPHRNDGLRVAVRSWFNSLFIACATGLVVLVIVGCIQPTFSLEVLGIIGVAIESGQRFNEAINYHSVFSMARLIMDQASYLGTPGDYLGLGTLTSLLILTVLVVPLAQVFTLVAQWFMRMDSKRRNRLAIMIEILQAWQYVEVYLLSIFVATWQLGGVSEFMVNAYCDSLKETFARLVYFGILEEEDAQCFRVQADIESASYVLVAAAAVLAFLTTLVNKAVKQFNRDKELSLHPLRPVQKRLELIEDELDTSDIRPVGVQFTDMFRIFLRKQDLPDATLGDAEKMGSFEPDDTFEHNDDDDDNEAPLTNIDLS